MQERGDNIDTAAEEIMAGRGDVIGPAKKNWRPQPIFKRGSFALLGVMEKVFD